MVKLFDFDFTVYLGKFYFVGPPESPLLVGNNDVMNVYEYQVIAKA